MNLSGINESLTLGTTDAGIYNTSGDLYGSGSAGEHVVDSMELQRKYILDYQEYRRVLEECNTTLHSQSYPTDGSSYCNATWDTMQCWGYTKADTTVLQPCPAYIYLSNPMAFSRKMCTADGTWYMHPESKRVWTDYTMCYDKNLVENHKRVLYMYYYGFGISIVLLVISLIIFSLFRQLKCVRVTVHKHLFFSYLLTAILWILYYMLVPMDSDVLTHNPLWCQILHVLTHYMTVCNYAWMFCEGFYLHALIVIAFTKDKKLLYICYFIGWVFPLVPMLVYTCLRAVNEEDSKRCWTSDSVLHWILAAPINLSLIVNFFFAINIMRILLSKLRSVNTNETMQTRRAVRATLILIPLLGLTYIFLPFKPPPGSDGEFIYSMVSAFFVSFQGVFVSLVFCFFNGEKLGELLQSPAVVQYHDQMVLSILRRHLQGLELFQSPWIRRRLGGRRRSTTMTFTLPEYSVAPSKANVLKRTSIDNIHQPDTYRNGPSTIGTEAYQMVPVSDKLETNYIHDEEEGLV